VSGPSWGRTSPDRWCGQRGPAAWPARRSGLARPAGSPRLSGRQPSLARDHEMFRATVPDGCCALEYSEPLGTWERQSARGARHDRSRARRGVDPAAAGRPSTKSQPCTAVGSRSPLARSRERGRGRGDVDFTVAAAARDNLRWCADHGVHVVCGTTASTRPISRPCGPGSQGMRTRSWPELLDGAALMMRCAEVCAPWVGGAGLSSFITTTSGCTLRDVARDDPPDAGARDAAGVGDWPRSDRERARSGARGGRVPGGVHVHSVRLPGSSHTRR